VSPVRVLIADDSSLMRALLSEFLSADPDIHVVGTAADGLLAVRMVESLRPDVLLLDVQMPHLSGLEALEQIMQRRPMPVVVISGLESHSFVTQAFQLGAVDVIAKPSGPVSVDIYKVQDELIAKIKAAALADVRALLNMSALSVAAPLPPITPKRVTGKQASLAVVIAASTGGPRTLERVLHQLPTDLPATVLIVQHMPAGFTSSFAARLDQQCPIPVKEAEESELLLSAQAYVAPGDYHLRLTRSENKKGVVIHLDDLSPPVQSLRPRADLTMSDAAQLFGERCLGIVLTGMGNDGTVGLSQILKSGGITIAQDERTSAIYGMPRVAAERGVAQIVLPIQKVASEIIRWCEKWESRKALQV